MEYFYDYSRKGRNFLIKLILSAGVLLYFVLPTYKNYIKPDIINLEKIEAVQNGWISIKKSGRTMWFYKENGNYKKGWYHDNNSNGWYYFYDKQLKFNFTNIKTSLMYDPSYEKSSWLEIDNLLYEFEIGGKLIENSGWKNYRGKWMYYIPGDYGAYKDTTIEITGIKYSFDSNGHLK